MNRKPTVLLNAIKLHQGRDRVPTGNFQHVKFLSSELGKIPDINLKIIADEDTFRPIAEGVDADKVFKVQFRSNSVLKADLAIVKAVHHLKPDIYHRPTGQLPFLPLRCKAIAGIADLNFKWLKTSFVKLIYKNLSYTWTVSRADRLICVSQFTAQDIIQRFKAVPAQVRVIYHGANPLPEPDFSLVPQEEAYWFAFAHQEHKNAELCIRCLSRLPEHNTMKLLIVGKNDYVSNIIRPLINRMGLNHRVELLGSISSEQISGLYQKAKALLFPSRFEGFGLPVLEAMQAGCPVLSSNACSLPEVVGHAAPTLDPDDEEGWLVCMKRIVRDKSWRDELILKGRQQAKLFSWKKSAQQTAQIYLEVFNEPSAR